MLVSQGSEWLAVPVPGTVAMALRASGLSALQGQTVEPTSARIDAYDWWYCCSFESPGPLAPGESWMLCLDGLATVADVWLNGDLLLHTENMFVAHAVDVTTRLSVRNDLVLRFHALDTLLATRRPRPAWRSPMVEHQQLRWFRTTLLGRTPGWSPPVPPVGPWRPVRLARRTEFHVDGVDLRSSLDGDAGLLAVSFELRALGEQRVTSARLRVALDARTVCDLPMVIAAPSAEGPRTADDNSRAAAVVASGVARIAGVLRWWPHTHGPQPLYDVSLIIDIGDAQRVVRLGRVGFRELTLNTANGAFALSVNGVEIFCRGACWTPPDAASLSASSDEYRRTLEMVRNAGMNMLRVVGSTVYETTAFHDLCDELGILLWQDFMFANMDYPDDPVFLASAEEEARQALSVWQGRPSMAILCGNSEGEQQAAMWGAPRSRWTSRWFTETLPRLCAERCPDVPYWPSSSSGGAFPHQPNAGTCSYYGVGAYLRPLDDARLSEVQFASECLAFANVPEERVLAAVGGGALMRTHTPAWKAGVPRDLGAGWDFDDVRDHYLSRVFGVDPVALRSIEPERYLALSRIVTGEVMLAAFSEWRRAGSRTSGALVWFLRDLVPGAGWGLLDVEGTPKAAFHYLRRILGDVALFFTDDGLNGAYVHVVNERPDEWSGELSVRLYRDGEVEVERGQQQISLAARGVLAISVASLFDSLPDTTYAYRFGPPGHDLAVASLQAKDDTDRHDAFHFPVTRPSRVESDLGMTATAWPLPDGDARLAIRSRRFAQAVSIDVPGFEPDDNYFHLAPGGCREVMLRRCAHSNQLRGGSVTPTNARTSTRIELRTDPPVPDTRQR
jgi:beta-mannosidase